MEWTLAIHRVLNYSSNTWFVYDCLKVERKILDNWANC